MAAFSFDLVATDDRSRARAGVFRTPHGDVLTPAFMPVGTQATVKALGPSDLGSAGAQMILANAYHLMLRPGADLIASLGGLHAFMAWDRPILTDSGGFQVFSLGRRGGRPLAVVDEDGVTFRSHLDGSVHRLTPERAIEIGAQLGADVIMALDECSASDADYVTIRAAMERTHRWAERCVRRWRDLEAGKRGPPPQALFAIVQGGTFADLRRASAAFVAGLDLPGIAIGGEAIGFSFEDTCRVLDWVADSLPGDRPRYAMGVGDVESFFAVVARGADLFDSVLPSRLARHGSLLTSDGRIRISSACFADDPRPVDPDCRCPACADFSRAYLRHLFKAGELLAQRLATVHNLTFCLDLAAAIRRSIGEGAFASFSADYLARFRRGHDR